jgi:hypothetical protein
VVALAAAAVKVKHGALTVAGTTAASGKVELLGLKTSGGPASFGVVAKASASGKFKLHAHLKRGVRWVLQLENAPGGSFSALRKVNVR